MYSSSLNTRDRSGAVVAALLIQAALIIAFLNITGKLDKSTGESRLRLVDVRLQVPPPEPQTIQIRKFKAKAGGSAPRTSNSDQRTVAAPVDLGHRALTEAPVAPPVERARTDGGPSVGGGAAGSGGSGNGVGNGNGAGSGDGGMMVEPPHLVTPVLSTDDFPAEMLSEWPRHATIFLRLKINPAGFVSECLLDRGTNVPAIDSQMCNTAHERLRFRPALNRSGQAVAGWFGYAQPAPR